MTPRFRKWLFETLYRNRHLYRFASTVPFAGQWRIWQRLVLTRLVGRDVLELGCGLGDLLADMGTKGYRCQAIEHSSEMVGAARQTLRKRGVEALVVEGDAQALPFAAESFDTVVSTFPNEYIYAQDTISEVARVLRPGGRLVVIEGAQLLSHGFGQSLLVILQMFVYGPRALKKQTSDIQGPETRTQVLVQAQFGKRIPLEQFHLQRRSEHVKSERWEVYITIGEKKKSE